MKSNFKFVKTEPPTEAYIKTYCPHSTMDEHATEIFNAIKGAS